MSFVALLIVAAGIPAALAAVSQATLGEWHPVPGVGSTPEIRDWFERELSTSEIIPVAMRVLLGVLWLLWAGMLLSVLASIVSSRPSLERVRLPRLGMFDGIAQWIAAGLTALSSFAPNVAHAIDTTPPVPVVQAVDHDTTTTVAQTADVRLVSSRAGWERVQQGESIETFTARTLGDGSRWPEVWELNEGRTMNDGTMWSAPWKLRAGWELELPASRPAKPSADAVAARELRLVDDDQADEPAATEAAGELSDSTGGVRRHPVAAGESYWQIAEDDLRATSGREPSGAQVLTYTNHLIALNAPRLAYDDPTMLQPGDEVHLDAKPTPPAAVVPVPSRTVVAGDSYWNLAETELRVELGAEPDAAAVLDRTNHLIALNAPRLGHDDPTMLQPGDVVYHADPTVDTPQESVTPSGQETPPTRSHHDAGDGRESERSTRDTPEAAGDRNDRQAPQGSGTVNHTDTTSQSPDNAGATEPVAAGADRTPSGPITHSTNDPAEAAPSPARGGLEGKNAGGPAAGTEDTSRGSTPTDSAASLVSPTMLAGLSLLGASGLAAAYMTRRRKANQKARTHMQPAPLTETGRKLVSEVVYRDVSDVTWMDLELRWLAHNIDPDHRAGILVQLVQLDTSRRLEVAFVEPPVAAPPAGWTALADRVWRLNRSHDDSELAAVDQMPPVVPALATLGDPAEGAQLYINLEAPRGLCLAGDPDLGQAWLTNLVWEIGGAAVAERPDILLVDSTVSGWDQLDGVSTVSESEALAGLAGSAADDRAMLDRRVNQWEAWPPTIVVMGCETIDDGWQEIAGRGDVAVITTHRALQGSLVIELRDGELRIDDWGLTVEAAQMSPSTVSAAETVLEIADEEPVADEMTIPPVWQDTPLIEEITVDEWEAPSWPLMVHLLGEPEVVNDGVDVKLTAQQLAIVSYIAVHRDVSTHDLWNMVWGDDKELKGSRIRDALSELRTALGDKNGERFIRHVEDGRVRAGSELGSDVAVFEALKSRGEQEPTELAARLHEMVYLARGRPFAFPQAARQHWRWVDLEQHEASWENRVATAADELSRLYLGRGDPGAARDIAERGLRANALSAPLTEALMNAYAGLKAVEAAQQVYEAHDRALLDRDFGGASEETRRVLERIRAAAQEPGGAGDVAMSS